jgi:hypothetical protein
MFLVVTLMSLDPILKFRFSIENSLSYDLCAANGTKKRVYIVIGKNICHPSMWWEKFQCLLDI